MSQPYIGEIRLFAGDFAPNGWAFCDGQLLPISEYETLFFLIGTTYGGDGQFTFGLPDLRARVPVHSGQGAGLSQRTLGELGGTESVALTAGQLPVHNHVLAGARSGHVASPAGAMPAGARDYAAFRTPGTTVPMAAAGGVAGGGQPHENQAPYLCVSFIISLFGIFPSQN